MYLIAVIDPEYTDQQIGCGESAAGDFATANNDALSFVRAAL